MTVSKIKENIKAIQEEKREEPLRTGLEALKLEVKRWCAIALVNNQMRLDEMKGTNNETI